MNNSKEYQQGFKDGRKAEAEITLDNLEIILDQMAERPHKTSHILSCISDLKRDLKKQDKL